MNVEEFQLHLSDLSNLLRRGGGKKVADELDDVCASLQPFRERRLHDLLAMVANAETIIRTGKPDGKRPRPSKKKATPLQIDQATGRVRDLYHRATDITVSRDEIEAACAELDKLELSKAVLEALAKDLLITEKFKTKPQVIAKIRDAIMIRKGTYQRASV